MNSLRQLLCFVVLTTFLLSTTALAVMAQQTPTLGESSPGDLQSAAGTVHTVGEGTHIVDAATLQSVSSVVVAQGATAVIDFASAANLALSGNLVNAGTIYAASSDPAVSTASIAASNIYNQAGALLTSILPAAGIPGFTSAVSNLNLNLSAVHDIINQGTISSAGNLNLTAGGQIVNQAQAAMTAAQSLALTSAIGSITNSGLIAAIAGNVSVASQAAQAMAVNNAAGVLSALNGAINASTASAADLAAKPSLSVLGGDLVAKELNFACEGGLVQLDVNNITGQLNISAGETHVTAATPNLALGNMHITGDPTYFNTSGDVQLSGSLSGLANLAIVASGNITTSATGAQTITTGSGTLTSGHVLLIAGANVTANPVPGEPGQQGPDTTTTLTISGASSSGGNINLPNYSIDTTAGSPGWGGTVTLVAYSTAGGGTAGVGTISIADITTGQTSSTPSDTAGQNGAVVIIAGTPSGQAITTGTINSSGNIVNSFLYNGNVFIGSATPTFLFNPSADGNPLTPTTAINNNPSTVYPGVTQFAVSTATGINAGSQLVLNPFGANAETVTVSGPPSGPTITVSSPIQFAHTNSEYVYVSSPSASVVVDPGGGNPGQLTQVLKDNAVIAPGATQAGNITVGGITAGANVVIQTGGSVDVTGDISLTQNPQLQSPPTAYNANPKVSVTAGSVTVEAEVTVSSAISGCSTCLDSLDIITQSLTNMGTISGNYVSITNSAGGLAVSNSGTMSGTGNNPMIGIESTGSLTLSGAGSMTVPQYSVIELAGGDGSTLTITDSHTLVTGTGGIVMLNAQGSGGTIEVSDDVTLTVNGGAVVSINTPNLNLGDSATLVGMGPPSTFVVTSGALAQTPLPLTVNLTGQKATIGSASGGAVIMRPTDGQNITITTSQSQSTLNVTGGPLYLFTGTNLATKVTGQVIVSSGVSLNASGGSSKVVNPNGGITGIAFEPYVGQALNPGPPPSDFTPYDAYTYPQVLVLLAPIVATGLFQVLGTYTQGAEYLQGFDPTQSTSYVIEDSAQYTIQAAKHVGLLVSAGAYVQNLDHSVNVVGTNVEIDHALAQAQKHGNVIDIVVGNECIVGGPAPQESTAMLAQSMNYAQTQRGSYGFSPSTLPVTTRQKYGVLSGVTIHDSTVDLLNGCQNCFSVGTFQAIANFLGAEDHVYANAYPYYDSPFNTTVSPGMGQAAFTSAVISQIQADLGGTLNAFQQKSITPRLFVGETGWATQADPDNAPQANVTLAGWYYPAMQQWSYSNAGSNPLGYQVPILGYFESYDEPWKYDAIDPGSGGEPFFGVWTATGTTTAIANTGTFYNLTGIAAKTYPQGGTNVPFISIFSPPQAPPLVAPPDSTATGRVVFNPLGTGGASISNSTTVTNEQIGTRISTDYTPGGQQAATHMSTDLIGLEPPGTSPYATTGGGWQSSGDGSVWLCTDCVGTTSDGMSQNAIRAVQKIAYLESGEDADSESNAGVQEQESTWRGQEVSGTRTINGLSASSRLGQASSTNVGLTASRVFNLPKGVALFHAPHPVVVRTQEGDVHISKGSLVFVVETGNDVAIYNLHDSRVGDIRVVADKRLVTIKPGKQLVLTRKQGADFNAVNPGKIAYRNPRELALGGNVNAFVADFSIPSAMVTIPPLKNMLTSTRSQERKLARQLLKDAVIMANVYGSAGRYTAAP